jgi:N-acetylmuramoyl-L-alanine amidase
MRSIGLLGLLSVGWAQTICIDPGHPSEVGRGATGKKISEMAVAWKTAVALKPMLEKAGYRVVLTKTSEKQYVSNRDRARIANQSGANLLLRLHGDAGPKSGFSSYYPDRTITLTDRTGPSAKILAASKQSAQFFHPAVIKSLKGELRDAGLKTDRDTAVGKKQGALTGSIYSDVPVILVEMLVITNPRDEAWITRPGNIDRLAKALLAGIQAAVPIKKTGGSTR